jgi:ribosomal protein L18E
VGLRYHERDEERAESQRGHHQYGQDDVAIWKTLAQRLEEASRNRMPLPLPPNLKG